MPQIAQQDYIYIEVADWGGTALPDETKKKIKAAIENGTIYDIIFIQPGTKGTNSEVSARVVAVDYANDLIIVWSFADGEMQTIDFAI